MYQAVLHDVVVVKPETIILIAGNQNFPTESSKSAYFSRKEIPRQ
jgi:hypothetical protein